MTETLKKYLVTKWWIPTMLFGISFILIMNGSLFQNNIFGFFTLILFGFILLISSIWQLLKGRKLIGLLQLSILTLPFLLIGFMAYLFAGIMDKVDGELSRERIEPLIIEKTDLNIPKDFEILENLIEHTEGAFDSDYTIGLKIKYQESEEKQITEQIHKGINSKSEKGIWKSYANGFNFEHSENEINRAEPFYFKIDTLSNTIELNLMHL